jgi:hypothetical protein
MAELTKKEIQDQLKKLGISSSSELRLYSKEYEEYSSSQNPLPYKSREYQKSLEMNQQDRRARARKLARTCKSLFPVIGSLFTLSRVRTYKK